VWMRSGFVSAGRGVNRGDASISVYLYQVSWADVNVDLLLPRIMVFGDGRLMEMR